MNTNLSTIPQLLQEARKQALYTKLIAQLNKDLAMAGAVLQFSGQTTPKALKTELCKLVYQLMQDRFADYLNLLYIIDVSEEKVKALYETDMAKQAVQVSFLILKREWQKVWYRNRL